MSILSKSTLAFSASILALGLAMPGVSAAANTSPQRCAVGAPLTYGVELKFRH